MRITKARKRPAGRSPRGGRYSARLSDAAARGRHRSFRMNPEFFSLVVDSLAEYAVLTIDRNLVLSSWNSAAGRIFGYSEEEAIGSPIERLFTDEDRANGYPKREFDEALLKGRVQDERYHLAKGRRRFWTYGLAFPLLDAKKRIRGYVKIVRDETARKRAADELVANEERIRLAIEATHVGTWDYVVETGKLELSPECRDILGCAECASFDEILESLLPEDRARLDQGIAACLAGKTPACEVEFRTANIRDGERWAILKARLLASRDGSTCPRLIGLVIDSTDKKRAQLEAADLTASLDRRVKERTASLLLANEELESFAYSASHDLRAPLRKMRVFCQMILAEEAAALSEKGRDYFTRIQESAASMDALIDATLNLSLATRKKMSPESVDLSGMAAGLVEDLRRRDPGRLTVVQIEAGMIAQGDRDLLRLALSNLLDNAWKFTSTRPEGRIEFGVLRSAGPDVYFVRDNGVGFDMCYAEKIFRPFEKLHEHGAFAGTGVGLGIVQRVVRRHQGKVWAEGKPGEGAAIYFTLFSEALK